MMAEKLYFAYGSNINLDQMAFRCPEAVPVGPVMLENYELLFRGISANGGVATIHPKQGSYVYGLLWKITSACEQSLDRYEGWPHLYRKEQVQVFDESGQRIPVMAYVMNDKYRAPSIPSDSYYHGIRDGFIQNKLPLKYLEQALGHVHREVFQQSRAHRLKKFGREAR